MRPMRSTAVASTTTRPAPDIAIVMRCCRCQSFIEPSFAEYWHIGDTTMRFESRTGPRSKGVKRGAIMRVPEVVWRDQRPSSGEVAARGAAVQPGRHMRPARLPHRALAIGALSAEPARRRTFRLKPMTICHDVIAAIGNTPVIRLRRASEETGCTILGKAEFMNPGQSVKDRAALYIIKDAIETGTLRPGGVIVEGTAGNTGIGLALVGNAMGFRTVIVIPDTQSQEKKDMLRLAGAELVEVPAVPYVNPNNYVKVSGRLAERLAREEPDGATWANQFDNVANRLAHLETTGPEIWDETGGEVHGFTCAVGTGGTLAGVGLALKERNPGVVIALADPMGAALHSYYTTGELKATGSSITE